MHKILYLSQSDVIKNGATSMNDVINDLENQFRVQDSGDYLLPPKIVLKWPGEHSEETVGRINAMAGYLGGNVKMAGLKWIGSGPQNPFKYNLPRASAIIILNDPITMIPIAIMDGTVISAMRTGGLTGLCCKYLAPSNSEIVALFGAGVQCKTQIMGIMSTTPTVKRIRIYDYYQERSVAFAKDMEKRIGVEFEVVTDRAKNARDADIIVTATTATEPVLRLSDITKGCYIAHIGGMEIDYDIIYKADKVVMDNWEVSKHRLGDTLSYMASRGMIDDGRIDASVTDLVCGKKIGRENDEQITYTSNVGLGTYDVAVATRVYRNAQSSGLGTELVLWDDPNWL